MDHLQQELTRLFGHTAFRAGQHEIVEAAVEGRDTLAVMPTGGGKSLTYQLPAMLVPGATLVLSPLIALMKDQAENLPPAVAERSTIINSSLDSSEVGRRLSMLKSGRVKMVYAAPERLRQPPFLHALRRAEVSLVVVDEAHCISQWGHDFRPDYRAVGKAVEALNPRSVLAVTATATPDVQDDIERQLGRPLHRIIRPTYRDNLFLSCRKVNGEDDKLWATLDLCRDTPGMGLVYAGSREKCEQLSRMLKRQGIAAGFYHAGLPPEERARAQDDFMQGRVRVMVATVAFGMGVDKSDIRFLIHFHPSRTLENYYQEAGRAGRDGEPSFCTLLISSGDAASSTRHLREDTLTLEQVRAVYNAARQAVGRRRLGPVSFDSLTQAVGGDEGLVRSTLPLLEETGLIARHVDIPRSMRLHPDSYSNGGEEEQAGPADGWAELGAAIGGGGEFDPVTLSDETGIPLPDLEETILRCQDAGHLTYRAAPRDFLLEILPAPADTRQRMEATLTHRSSGAKRRAEAMLAYARDRKCRHGAIARYFGDRWPNLKCGACDVCMGGTLTPGPSPGAAGEGSLSNGAAAASRWGSAVTSPPSPAAPGEGGRGGEGIPPSEAPLAALRLVHDLAQGYRPWAIGKTGLMRALRGTPDAPMRQDRTPQFGLLANLKKSEVERLIEALIEAGYLRRDEEDEYRRLYLTAEGRDAVSTGEVDIEWRMTPVAPEKPSKGERRSRSGGNGSGASMDDLPTEVDPAAYEELKSWRWQLAQQDNVPPYVIFADKTLLALAAHKPTNEFDLLEIPGIGPAKAAKFGEAVLDILRKHSSG